MSLLKVNDIEGATSNEFPVPYLQYQHKYLTSSSQLAKGGAIGELNSDLRISFTPKSASSNLYLEFFAPFVFPNSTNLQYAYFYDVTAGAGVNLPPAVGSRVRCHWTNRNGPNDANDNDVCNMRIITPASNTTARTYTIYWGTEGASAQFFVSTLASGAGSVYPMTFVITELAA